MFSFLRNGHFEFGLAPLVIASEPMSIGLKEEEKDLNSTGPLKIPIPKNAQTSTKCSVTAAASTTNSSFIGSLPKKIVLKCDSPQIFSIESRPDCGESSKNYDESSKACVDDSGNKPSSSAKSNIYTASTQETVVFEGYREVGTSSGFNSDLDSESPFYSSDIDSDTSDEPPLLWNFADYFANLPGNDWCVRIPQCFIEDEFNLFELPDVFRCPLTLTDETGSGKEEYDEYVFDDLLDFITIEDLTGKRVSQF